MRLLREEEIALLDWAEEFSVTKLDTFLFRSIGLRSKDFSDSGSYIPGVAMDLVAWCNQNIDRAPALFEEAVSRYPETPQAPAFAVAAARLKRALVKLESATPDEAILVRGVPIVNRTRLRNHLKEVRDRDDPAVVVVQGESGLGRSHSWYLIEYVARITRAALPVRADFVSPALANQKLPDVFDHLVVSLGFQAGEVRRPTETGVTPNTLAGRYAGEVARLLRGRASTQLPIWLVFDSLDNSKYPVLPEVKSFVAQLADLRMDNEFDRCTIFLLAADTASEPHDPFDRIGRDPITPFTDEEIAEAAKKINALGDSPLAPSDLEARILDIKQLGSPACRELCAAVAGKLVQLRREVRA